MCSLDRRTLPPACALFPLSLIHIFVPAGVGILRYADVLWANLLPLLAICFITTPLVYGVTAWAVQLTMRAIQKKEARHD